MPAGETIQAKIKWAKEHAGKRFRTASGKDGRIGAVSILGEIILSLEKARPIDEQTVVYWTILYPGAKDGLLVNPEELTPLDVGSGNPNTGVSKGLESLDRIEKEVRRKL